MTRFYRLSLSLIVLFISASALQAQEMKLPEAIHIGSGGYDSLFSAKLWSDLQQPGLLHSLMLEEFARMNDLSIDSDKDSTVFELGTRAFRHTKHRRHYFLVTELEDPRQYTHLEPFSMIDFNRTDGFFLGLGQSGMVDLGKHDQLGVNLGGGYGFANQRWQAFGGAEYRIPLAERKESEDTVFEHVFAVPPTFVVGGEFHNITSTDDSWRVRRLENAAYAFFAREDFRDYYKLAGYSAYLSLRGDRHSELKIEWRSDNYESRPQTVFYGRWGGNKVLPVNPAVAEGRLNSIVVTAQRENVRPHGTRSMNIAGDSVSFEQLKGESSILQAEFGHMPGVDFGFNRYILDSRTFSPITAFLSFDSRLRFEATTGDLIPQKAEYLGGPSTLPGLYNKSIAGNRMLLLNTEVRMNLAEFSKVFGPDLQIAITNDFGYVGLTTESSMFSGFEGLKFSTIVYNVGVLVGWTQGVQFGVCWRTDVKDTPRIVFRLERPF